MTRNEIDARLSRGIRIGNGFYYNGKRYATIEYHDQYILIYPKDYSNVVRLNYKDISRIEMATFDGKTVNILHGEATDLFA